MENRTAGRIGTIYENADWFRMKTEQDRGEIFIYGIIGDGWSDDGVTAGRFKDELRALGNVKGIDLRIDSEGGGVFQARTIYTLLREHKAPVTVHIDGLAASSASFIAMAGNEILIADGAFMMIHNAWTFAIGDAAKLRKSADQLENVTDTIRKTYVGRTGQDIETITEKMNAETWFEAADAVEFGLADKVVGELKIAAAVTDAWQYQNLPAALRPRRIKARAQVAAMRQLVVGNAGTANQ
jgi:ATP-dependent Clp protease protease subunit